MLRIYFLQQWFNLSDPAVEEALYDSPVMRQFVGIDLGQEPAPDETTVCKFRHVLEEHRLGGKILGTVNLHLQARGVRITTGTIVDATILHAPTSTKNRDQQRDPEMHQTKKGKQWFFGMKAHVGVYLSAAKNPDSRRVVLWFTDNVPTTPSPEVKARQKSLSGKELHTEKQALEQLFRTGTVVCTLLKKSSLSDEHEMRYRVNSGIPRPQPPQRLPVLVSPLAAAEFLASRKSRRRKRGWRHALPAAARASCENPEAR